MRIVHKIVLTSLCLLSALLMNSVLSVHANPTLQPPSNTSGSSSSQSVPTPQKILDRPPTPESTETGLTSSSSTRASSLHKSWQTLPFFSHGQPAEGRRNFEVVKSGRAQSMPATSAGSSADSQAIASATSGAAAPSPGDGWCFYGPSNCSNVVRNNGPVMHNGQFVIDVWAGCGSSGCYSSCNNQVLFEPNGGYSGDCHYIFLQELYFQDFCAGSGSSASVFAVLNQYTDNGGTGLGSCSLVGGSAIESPSGSSVTYTYDYAPFPSDGTAPNGGPGCGGVTPCLSDSDVRQSAARIAQYRGCVQDGIRCEVLVLIPFNICQDTGTIRFCPASNILAG